MTNIEHFTKEDLRVDQGLTHLGDVLKACGVATRPADFVSRHLDDDEWSFHQFPDKNGVRRAKHYAVTRQGFFAVLGVVPRTERTREFKRWVNHEVLPSVMDNGGYISPGITAKQNVRMIEKLAYLQVRDVLEGAGGYTTRDVVVRQAFAQIQNKIHVAVTSLTARELMSSRKIDNWTGKNGPTKADLMAAKNYLTESEAKKMRAVSSIAAGLFSARELDQGEYMIEDVSRLVDEAIRIVQS